MCGKKGVKMHNILILLSLVRENKRRFTMEEKKKSSLAKRFKQTRFYRSINTFASSAIIGLAITLLIFAYKVYFGKKQFDETVDRLDNISRSLSTRCLGKFPAYISEINDVFSTLQSGDTVIIFEDVLYYGIKSDPAGFCRLQQLLLNHSRQGGKVIVAYYDNHAKGVNSPRQSVFHNMIVESRIAPKYLNQMSSARYERMEQLSEKEPVDQRDRGQRRRLLAHADSCVTEEFFELTRDNNIEAAQQVVESYLSFFDVIKREASSSVMSDAIINNLCTSLDSIIHHYLGKGKDKKRIREIRFSDYEKMYSDITDCIADYYRYHGIEMIPLNEYLTMSCWLIKPANSNRSVASILAFPSKYSSDEIGFYSQDELFSDYMTTILNGVRGNSNENKERPSNF